MDYDCLQAAALPEKGSYVLLMKLPADRQTGYGRHGSRLFHGGFYAYVGSALGGLMPRLHRHLREDKKLHWHIDYLLREARITGILVYGAATRAECRIAEIIGKKYPVIAGFGSSDCRCPGHLFYSGKEMKEEVTAGLEAAGIHPVSVTIRDNREE